MAITTGEKMKICTKCLYVYSSSLTEYCQYDGKKCVDSVSPKGRLLVEKLKKREDEPNR